jgi:hypothetical protein
VPDQTAQVARLIPSEPIINKGPGGLTFNTPCIACKPDDIERDNPFA